MRICSLTGFLLLSLVASPFARAAEIDFNRDIRPILSDRCFHCHGPDEAERKADLRLDLRQSDLDTEELLYRITTDDDDDIMPPPKSKLVLTNAEKKLLSQWIEEGGEFAAHWSFETQTRPELPKVSDPAWAKNPIDHFALARLDREKTKPSPQASRETLIRRVSFDLTGLPPTPEEVANFVADESPSAYEKVVDRLLASPRYGERMATEWMDAARYADTSGYQYDWPRTMWRWRDWVIDAYNDNLSYNQFITWQLAGDLLPNATLEQQIATGFNRNHPFTIEGGTIDEEYRVSYVADRVTTMGTVFMGLTLDCARCHDHKFDAISQQDFFQLYAFFNHLPERGRVGGKPAFAPPAIPAPTPEQSAQLTSLRSEIGKLKAQRDRPQSGTEAKQAAWEQSIPSTAWTVIEPTSYESKGGATLALQDDLSILATGKNPNKETYVVTLPLAGEKPITAIRVDALTHPSMVGNGPGRSSNGNAVLTNVSVEGSKIAKASADYEQQNYPIRNTIDADPNSGWAFDGNTNHADHAAVFAFENPSSTDQLKVTLQFQSGFAAHTFGRVRFAITHAPEPSLEDTNRRLREIAAKPNEKRTVKEAAEISRAFRLATDPEFAKLGAEISTLEARAAALEKEIPQTMIMSDAQPRETFILERGAYDQPRGKVEANTPEHLPPFPADAPRNRLGLSHWLTAPENPLTARVTMNRVWHQIFGSGIVKTVNDFGSQADWPTHPQLLDWLAVEFIESGWDLKAMLKLIVTSATYQQVSDTTPEMLERDPANELLARGPRNRLSAEMVRDHLLYSGGLLTEKLGGPSVKPYQPAGLWKELTLRPNFMQVYEPDEGADGYRRGLYTFWKRAAHHPMMATFDAPNREVCTFSRGATNTPLQALVLLHDPQFLDAARGLAKRARSESNNPTDQIAYAFVTATSRQPTPEESKTLAQLYQRELSHFQTQKEEARALAGEDDPATAALVMTTRLILNLSETITNG